MATTIVPGQLHGGQVCPNALFQNTLQLDLDIRVVDNRVQLPDNSASKRTFISAHTPNTSSLIGTQFMTIPASSRETLRPDALRLPKFL